jgi:hypothetical protein
VYTMVYNKVVLFVCSLCGSFGRDDCELRGSCGVCGKWLMEYVEKWVGRRWEDA